MVEGTGGTNLPNPGMMPRFALPRPDQALRHVAVEAARIPRRGWPDALFWGDTGPLMAVAGREGLLDAVRIHTAGRLLISSVVEREIENWSKARGSKHATLASWARIIKAQLIDTGAVAVVAVQADESLLDDVLLKLRSLPQPGGSTDAQLVSAVKHAGEASTIAACVGVKKEGRRPVMLSNDGGARTVAAQYGVSVKDMGGLLKELVCAGLRSAEEAHDDFLALAKHTGVPARRWPSSADEMRCKSDGEVCKVCELLEDR